MQKKLIALAVAGLVSGGAFAQSNVTVSGRLNFAFENIKASGATLAGGDFTARNRIVDNSSELRFSGREDLGGGLNAWFTIGAGVDISGAAAEPFTRGLLASRNSAIGLDNKAWGSIMYGKWDVHYEAGAVPSVGNVDFGYIDQGLATFANLGLGAGQQGVGLAGGRLNNVVRYVSPTMSGFSAVVAYARNVEETANANGVAAANGDRKPYQFQFAPQYMNGPVTAFYSYYTDKESNAGATAANAGALLGSVVAGTPTASATGIASGLRDIRGDRLGASWKFDNGLKIGLLYDRSKTKIYNAVLGTGGAFEADLVRTAWSIPVSYVTGPHKITATYGRANDLTGSRSGLATGYDSSDTGASYFSLGYRHAFSKRTSAFVDYAKISNKSRAGYDFFAYAGVSATGSALPAASIGADPQTVQAGLFHTF